MPTRPKAGDLPDNLTDDNPQNMTDTELADTTRQAAADAEPVVTLALGHPHDEWNHGIEGVDPITAAGTDVPVDKEHALRDAAKDAGVTLRKVR